MALSLGVTLLVADGCDGKSGPIRVNKVVPAQGISGGGDQVVIEGNGFQPGKTQVEVRFGLRKAEYVTIASASEIHVVTPAGSKGPVDVTLMFDNGAQFKIPNGFRYQDAQSADDTRRAFFDGQKK